MTLQAQINAALRGRLVLGLTPDHGFSGLRVCKEDVERLRVEVSDPETENLIPAMAFGLSVGIRDKGRFRKLVLAGHTPAAQLRHERTGVENLYMTPDDIAAFHRRFVTMPTLSEETGLAIPEPRAAFKPAGVQAFSPDGADYGRIFLRDLAETVLSGKS